MKEKIKKEYLRKTRKLLETKLYSRNLIKGMNTWSVSLVRYSGPFLKWTREELKQMDQRTRKQMTMNKASHPRDHVTDYMCQKKKEEENIPALKTVLMHQYKTTYKSAGKDWLQPPKSILTTRGPTERP